MNLGVPCDGDIASPECLLWHPEGDLLPGWQVTIQEDRVLVVCPKCDQVWKAEEAPKPPQEGLVRGPGGQWLLPYKPPSENPTYR